jgi:NACHT domain
MLPHADPDYQRSISQQSGDRVVQIGQVIGNVYLTYSSPETEWAAASDVRLDRLAERLRGDLEASGQMYTELESEPVLSTVGYDMHPTGESPRSITLEVEEHGRLLIMAGAGLGKTATLRYVAHAAAKGRSSSARDEEYPNCVYIELSRYRRPSTFSPLDSVLVLLGEVLQSWQAFDQLPSLAALRELLATRTFLLLFDGLNEVAPEHRASCLQGISDLADRFPHERIILTTRPYRFPSLPNWRKVTILPLDRHRIVEFLARYTDASAARNLCELASRMGATLLQVPLFLQMVAELHRASESTTAGLLNSRSGLVARYVQHLMARGVDATSDPLAQAKTGLLLQGIAETAQRNGLSLDLEQIQSISVRSLDGKDKSVALAAAIERGIIVVDGRYARFCHHTLQEHFFARDVAARTDVDAGDGLYRLVHLRSYDEALAHLPAHLTDEHLLAVTARVIPINIGLCLRWADDLTAESRLPDCVDLCITELQRITRRLRGYELVIALNRALFGRLLPAQVLLASIFIIWIPIDVVSLVLRMLCQGKFTLVSSDLLGALHCVRSFELRQRVAATLVRVKTVSYLVNLEISKESQALLNDGMVAVIANRGDLFVQLQYLAFIGDEAVIEYLGEVLKVGNAYSRQAIHVLKKRAEQFPCERKRIVALIEALYRDKHVDPVVRGTAGRSLRSLGVQVSWWRDLADRQLGRTWNWIRAVFISLGVIVCVGLIDWSIYLTNVLGTDAFLLFSVYGLYFGIPLLVLVDAHRLGAVRIRHCPYLDSFSASQYAAFAFFLNVFMLPVYASIRRRIARNSVTPNYIPSL